MLLKTIIFFVNLKKVFRKCSGNCVEMMINKFEIVNYSLESSNSVLYLCGIGELV